MQTHYPLGKKPARPGAVKFKLSDYIDTTQLPPLPKSFGHENLIGTTAWNMYGNDDYGDCVWAGAAHETMMWNAEASKTVNFTTASVLSDYSAVTGFDPKNPATDQGTDMQQAASYRQKTGILDASGKRHQIAAYLAIDPGNLKEHYYATYLFGAVGIGIQFPSSAMDQFNAGQAWKVVPNSPIEGGHYIPIVAKRHFFTATDLIFVVTWARLQPMSVKFFQKYNDESVAYLTNEALTNNKSPEGFDAAALQRDLAALKR